MDVIIATALGINKKFHIRVRRSSKIVLARPFGMVSNQVLQMNPENTEGFFIRIIKSFKANNHKNVYHTVVENNTDINANRQIFHQSERTPNSARIKYEKYRKYTILFEITNETCVTTWQITESLCISTWAHPKCLCEPMDISLICILRLYPQYILEYSSATS